MKTKPRNYEMDGLATSVDEWEQRPPDVEQGFRRGFMQGFWRAVEAAKEGVPFEALELFCYGPIQRWRFKDRMRFGEIPPDILHPVRRRKNHD